MVVMSSLRFLYVAALLAGPAFSQQQRLWSSAFGVPGFNASFDYVVVGGGTAGLAVASRLAENASVAVIEAGGFYQQNNGNNSVVPLLSLTGIAFIDPTDTYLRQPLMDWDLVTLPQAAANNRRIHYAQGKALGGCSSINTMSYHRGTAGSYQRWADLVGDDTYTFDNLLPYFEKSCYLTPPNLEKRNAENATPIYDPAVFDNSKNGPLQVSWNNWVDPTITWIAKSLQSIGISISPEGFSSGSLAGHGAWVPSTISPENAHRSSAQTSYLDRAIQDTGIIVYTNAQATKILFDSSETPKATGVSVSTAGLEYTISANKEIILSAGVFHSPQLLMLSGIGPKAVLESYDIPLVADRPGVGQNLWDPISIGVSNYINTPSGGTITSNPATASAALEQYLEDGSGPFSSAAGYLSFEKVPSDLRSGLSNATITALASLPEDWPELEYIAGSFPAGNGSAVGSISAGLAAPFSRGNVTITSSSISDPPAINLGWLTHPADQEVLIAGVKRLRQAWSSEPAKSIRLGPENSPGDSVTSDEDILSYIRQSAQQLWHASSTCAMGKADDEDAVVDSNAKVYGVAGLRVVDISAFPFAVPGHPQASVYMFAEKIADNIKSTL